jgi:hypothetical protein
MKKSTKVLLGIATIWPLIYLMLFIAFMLSLFFLMSSGAPAPGETGGEGALPILPILLFSLHSLTILWVWALIAFYVVNVFKNDRVDKDKKALWAVVLFMGHMIAMPIYWYLYIWREDVTPSLASSERRWLNNAASHNWAQQATSNQREGEYVPPPQPPNWRD